MKQSYTDSVVKKATKVLLPTIGILFVLTLTLTLQGGVSCFTFTLPVQYKSRSINVNTGASSRLSSIARSTRQDTDASTTTATTTTTGSQSVNSNVQKMNMTRSNFVSNLLSSTVIMSMSMSMSTLLSPTTAIALDDTTLDTTIDTNNNSNSNSNSSTISNSNAQKSIESCPKTISGKPNNCVSTSNIKQLDTYSPPWTFEVTPDEAFARLKGLLSDAKSNSSGEYQFIQVDPDNKYIQVLVQRNFQSKDIIEFLIRPNDKVVVFRSYEQDNPDTGTNSGISDFGIIRKRLEDLRKKSAGVFSVMGEGLTADSFEGGATGKRNGIYGQLKSFYGLQSGAGFEDVFQDDDS